MHEDKSQAQVSQGAARAARVLGAVATREWTLSALARHLEVERRTLGRVISGLESEGFVSRNRKGLLQPGQGFAAAARLVARDHGLVALAGDVVADLSDVTGCTAMLHVPHGDYLFPEVVANPRDAIGLTIPPHISIELWRGIGRALLQRSGPAELRRIGALSPDPDFDGTVARERDLGFTVSHGELVANVTAVGAPVLEGDRAVGVLALIGLADDIVRHSDALVASAKRLGRLITASGEER